MLLVPCRNGVVVVWCGVVWCGVVWCGVVWLWGWWRGYGVGGAALVWVSTVVLV